MSARSSCARSASAGLRRARQDLQDAEREAMAAVRRASALLALSQRPYGLLDDAQLEARVRSLTERAGAAAAAIEAAEQALQQRRAQLAEQARQAQAAEQAAHRPQQARQTVIEGREQIRRLRQREADIIGVHWIWTALLPLFTLTSSPLLIGVIGAACAFIGPLWNVVIVSHATVLVPNDLLGRVTSAAMTLSWGVMSLASLGAGYLLSSVGPTGSVLVLTTMMLVTAVIATASPAVRQAPPLPAHDESA
ncbi:hypothetical protein [Nonomuraea insulae]|uniref:MFS transporter n=1 Tax=Nonomuraea insulae TaxID=1616787 RepID=A0ABW1DAQ9_9ACTN